MSEDSGSEDGSEEVVNRFPRLDCEEVDGLFEAVSAGKSRISKVQRRNVARDGKTLVEMTFQKTAAAATTATAAAAAAALATETSEIASEDKAGASNEEEVTKILNSIKGGQLTLNEFTVRNVLKGETYLRMELTSKDDADQKVSFQDDDGHDDDGDDYDDDDGDDDDDVGAKKGARMKIYSRNTL